MSRLIIFWITVQSYDDFVGCEKEKPDSENPDSLNFRRDFPEMTNDSRPFSSIDVLLPSNYGADALANLLAGDANFSAKLPYTYPREINSLNTYDSEF